MNLTEIERLLAEVEARPPSTDDPSIDGMKPSLVIEPDSADSAARALALCNGEQLAVVPVGGGSRIHLGNLPSRLDVLLSTVRMDGIYDYEPADSTVTVGAGTALAKLQREIGREKQFLPWDPPQKDKATIGGLLAAGEPGFRRRPGARPRDLLLGFEAVLADGTAVKAGGRVVKNVSGYDLMKLVVGSWGTLALITRAHLRLRPLPERVTTGAASFPGPSDVSEGLARLRKDNVVPEVMAVLDPGLAKLSSREGLPGWLLLLRFEGLEEEVRAAGEKARQALRAEDFWEIREDEGDRLWDQLRDFPTPGEVADYPIVARGQAVPSETLQLVEQWQGVGPMVAFPDVGLVYVKTKDPEAFLRLSEKAQSRGANAVLEAGPRDLKLEVDVFGETPGGFDLMRKIKEKLDPKGILSPGRFVGRL